MFRPEKTEIKDFIRLVVLSIATGYLFLVLFEMTATEIGDLVCVAGALFTFVK